MVADPSKICYYIFRRICVCRRVPPLQKGMVMKRLGVLLLVLLLLVGAYLYLALLVVNAGLDCYVLRHPVAIVHKQCYVGGIPIEEYFEMVDAGMPQAEIRAEQYRRLTAQQLEKERELEKELEKASHSKEAAEDE